MSGQLRIERDDAAGLRKFALTLAVAFPVMFWLVLPWIFGFSRPVWPWVLAGALAAVGMVWPKGIYPVYRVWMPLSAVLAWVNTRLILGLAFFALMMPLGWLMRRLRKLQFQQGFDDNLRSYRVPVTHRPGPEDLDNPF